MTGISKKILATATIAGTVAVLAADVQPASAATKVAAYNCMYRLSGEPGELTTGFDTGTTVYQLYGGDEIWGDNNQLPGNFLFRTHFRGYSLRIKKWGWVDRDALQIEYCEPPRSG